MKLAMGYIDFLNQLELVRKQNNITSVQIDVYLCLLQVCNRFGWPKSFRLSNIDICATTGLREKTIIEARKRIIEIGLIKYDPGITKQQKPTYYLQEYLLKVSINGSNQGSIGGSYPAGLQGVLNGTYNKRKEENRRKEKSGMRHTHTPFFLKEEKEKYATGLLEYIEDQCPLLHAHKNKISIDDAFDLINIFPGKDGYVALKAVLFKMNADGIKYNASIYGKVRVWMRNEVDKGYDDEIKSKIRASEKIRAAINYYLKNAEYKKYVDDYIEQNSSLPPIIFSNASESEINKKLKAV